MKNIILNYHDFKGLNSSFEKSKYTIDFEIFKLQLDSLVDLENVPLLKLLDHSLNTEKSYSLTFDDGYKSSLDIAEELNLRNLKGTFYIITDTLNSKKYLSKEDIKRISSLGMEIGSHSCSHRHLNRLSSNELITELSISKKIVEDITGVSVESIAFPGGMGGKREIEFALDCGYKICGLTRPNINNIPLISGSVNRINIKDDINLEQYKRLIDFDKMDLFKLLARYNLLAIPKFIDSNYRQKKKNK